MKDPVQYQNASKVLREGLCMVEQREAEMPHVWRLCAAQSGSALLASGGDGTPLLNRALNSEVTWRPWCPKARILKRRWELVI